jgi:hypothetical protein
LLRLALSAVILPLKMRSSSALLEISSNAQG